jgi:hypothetical protein
MAARPDHGKSRIWQPRATARVGVDTAEVSNQHNALHTQRYIGITLRCCGIRLYRTSAPPAATRTGAELVYRVACPLGPDPACCARPDGRAHAGRPCGQ